ncbi:MAG: methionyl-tRNA formyltransferase [Verrucomicrobiota bacterium]
MRIVYLGTGEIGLPTLDWIGSRKELDLVAVITQPDRPAGRGKKMQGAPVKLWAEARNIDIYQPQSVNKCETMEAFEALNVDLAVVFAFGQILKQPILDWPKFGCINLHASLLPRHRGASCIQAALLQGDTETGITVIQMDKGLDTGDILGSQALTISDQDTASSLHDRLAQLAPSVLSNVCLSIAEETIAPIGQDNDLATYAPKISKQQGEIDWSQNAIELERQVRAFYSWPGNFTYYKDQKGQVRRIKCFPPVQVGEAATSTPSKSGMVDRIEDGVLWVSCGSGTLGLALLQPENAKKMDIDAFARGYHLRPGDLLGNHSD